MDKVLGNSSLFYERCLALPKGFDVIPSMLELVDLLVSHFFTMVGSPIIVSAVLVQLNLGSIKVIQRYLD